MNIKFIITTQEQQTHRGKSVLGRGYALIKFCQLHMQLNSHPSLPLNSSYILAESNSQIISTGT